MGSAAFFTVPGAFAEELMKTAAQGEGPFYPDRLPLDTDNDLILINDAITPAVGRVVGPSSFRGFRKSGERARQCVGERFSEASERDIESSACI